MNGGSLPFWGLVRAKYAGSRHPSCLLLVDGLLARGGKESGLRKRGRKGGGKRPYCRLPNNFSRNGLRAPQRYQPLSLGRPYDGDL